MIFLHLRFMAVKSAKLVVNLKIMFAGSNILFCLSCLELDP